MDRSLRNSLAFLAIALILLAIVVIPGGKKEGPKVVAIPVLRAREEIKPGVAYVESGLFSTEVLTVPVESAASYLSMSPEALAAIRPPWLVTRYLRGGDLVYASDLVPPEQYRFVPDENLEVISFPADFDKVVGGQLWPGQLINIYLYGRSDEVRGAEGRIEQEYPRVELIADHVWVVDARTASGAATGQGVQVSGQNGEPAPTASSGTGLFGLGDIGGAGGAGGGNAPVSIVTVAMDHLVARRLVELMGSMGYRAWVSLSPKQIITVTPTIPRTATPTPTPTYSPTATNTPTHTFTPTASNTPTVTRTPTVAANLPGDRPSSLPAWTPAPGATTAPCAYWLWGTEAHLIGGYGDHMDYSGAKTYSGYYGGLAEVRVDACTDQGTIRASLDIVRDEQSPLVPAKGDAFRGQVVLVFDEIVGLEGYQRGGVAGDVEDGNMWFPDDLGFDIAYLPRSHVLLAAWGKGHIEVDGKTVYDNLSAYMMYTHQGSRDSRTHQVLRRDKSCCYSPADPNDGYTEQGDSELHFWFYDGAADANNFPAHPVFVNVVYEVTQDRNLPLPDAGKPLVLPNTGEDRITGGD